MSLGDMYKAVFVPKTTEGLDCLLTTNFRSRHHLSPSVRTGQAIPFHVTCMVKVSNITK